MNGFDLSALIAAVQEVVERGEFWFALIAMATSSPWMRGH